MLKNLSFSKHLSCLARIIGSGPGSHHGVVVNTDKGNSYLIHHPGPSSVTVTNASNMSNNWSKSHDIPVNGSKTVQQVYNGAGGRTNSGVVNYATGGTCIGVASNAEKTLKK
jgi:hypothetical protein